jgi:hypothetical protein
MSQDEQGRYQAPDQDLALADLASAARTTTASGTAFDTTAVDSVNATLIVSAVTGTNPTLDVVLETTADGTNYYTAGTFTQQTTTNAGLARVVGDLGDLSRWKWTIGGTDTPTFTFSIATTVDKDT